MSNATQPLNETNGLATFHDNERRLAMFRLSPKDEDDLREAHEIIVGHAG